MLDLTGQAHNMIFSDRLEAVCSDLLPEKKQPVGVLNFKQKCTGPADCCKKQPVSQPPIVNETVTNWHFFFIITPRVASCIFQIKNEQT